MIDGGTRTDDTSAGAAAALPKAHPYGELFWITFGRLVLLYFVPLLLVAIFFHVQYRYLLRDSQQAHLQVIAEHQANTFDLFLRERLVNLGNIVDDPVFVSGAVDEGRLRGFLEQLQQTSDAFVDLGVVDAAGELIAYVGPVAFPASVNYRGESWFKELTSRERRWLITEVYLGFRGSPHFTLAVRRRRGGTEQILRSALSPDRLSNYLDNLEGASEVHAAVVTGTGVLQITTPRAGEALRTAHITPPVDPPRGFVASARTNAGMDYAYAWLRETPWALIVTSAQASGTWISGILSRVSIATVAIFLVMGTLILVRTRQVVGRQLAFEHTQAELSGQLVHAEKLASVGELAAGIAHEINNPLAIIAEEVGLLKDSLDPSLGGGHVEAPVLGRHLDIIHDAVFRCSDITKKLLTFVRKTGTRLEPQRINAILDEVLGEILSNELAISNVKVVREYDGEACEVLADRNQLVQVFVNLVKNAMDAMPGGGTLTVTTGHRDGVVVIGVKDTGTGMTPDTLKRVFMPFFTTKDPGKGTGLGLSVSHSIIRGYEGRFYVESTPGRGSTFTIELPYLSGHA